MFQRWFGRRDPNAVVTDALYEQIVAAARQPVFYAEWDVPDTPLGRFEMVGLHLFLLLHRLKGEAGPAADLAQSLVDEFFAEVDSSVRELGIGDVGVPKRVKRLAKMFYGRAESYGTALERSDRHALAAALARNVRPDLAEWTAARSFADYVATVDESLRRQPSDSVLAGRIRFPAATETAR